MKKTYSTTKYNILLKMITFTGCFLFALLTFVTGLGFAPVILGLSFVILALIFYRFQVNAITVDISDSEVIIYERKKETARYARSQYSFEIIERRYPDNNFDNIILVVSSEDEQHEHDILILGPKKHKLISEDLNCQDSDLIGDTVTN